MSQTFTDNCYDSTHQVATDMAAIEANFAALKSMFSGAAAPSDLVAGMLWFDTTKNLPKMRNEANDGWLGVMQADTSHKLWVYRNTAPAGWAIDATVKDVVCALKNDGATGYGATAGTTGGTWTQPDCTLGLTQIPAHTHGSSGAHTHTIPYIATGGGITAALATSPEMSTTANFTSGSTAHEHTSVGGGLAHNHGTAYRPAAAIGVLMYMDI